MTIDKIASKYGSQFYFVFRLLVGLMFFVHGSYKVLGWFGGTAQAFGTMFWFAGAIEIVVGILVLVGFMTRWAAAVATIEMLAAWFIVHAKSGWNPLANGGEPAVLFFAAFLVLVAHGAGKWAIDK